MNGRLRQVCFQAARIAAFIPSSVQEGSGSSNRSFKAINKGRVTPAQAVPYAECTTPCQFPVTSEADILLKTGAILNGEADKFIPCSMMYKLFEAASCEKMCMIVPGADHVMSVVKDPEGYWAKVEMFLRNVDPALVERKG